MVRQSNDWMVARLVKPARWIASTSLRVKLRYGSVSSTTGLIFVSMFIPMSVRPLAFTRAKTSSRVGIRAPGAGTWAGSSGSVFVPQSTVLSCARVNSCTGLPTYGNFRSPGRTGAVSTQCDPLTVRSCSTTSLPSAVTPVSSSRVEMARLDSAFANAGRVFSGRVARPPRCAWMSNGAVYAFGSR